jgi:hypothetical protein
MGAPSLAFPAGAWYRSHRHGARSCDERGSRAARRRPVVPGVSGPAGERRLPRPACARHPRGPHTRAEQRVRDRDPDRTVPCSRIRCGFGAGTGARAGANLTIDATLGPMGAPRGARRLGDRVPHRRVLPSSPGTERGTRGDTPHRTGGDRSLRLRRCAVPDRVRPSQAAASTRGGDRIRPPRRGRAHDHRRSQLARDVVAVACADGDRVPGDPARRPVRVQARGIDHGRVRRTLCRADHREPRSPTS